MDAIRQRFLQDRVITATPAQRVVMLYDRLALDLTRARTDADEADRHLDHATQIVAELIGSLDRTAGGPAENLATLYTYLLRELMTAQLSGSVAGLAPVAAAVDTLREAWVRVADGTADGTADDAVAASPALAGTSWTA